MVLALQTTAPVYLCCHVRERMSGRRCVKLWRRNTTPFAWRKAILPLRVVSPAAPSTHSVHSSTHMHSTYLYSGPGTLTPQLQAISVRKRSTIMSSDTVFALSSGHGRCGVAVVRVSGPCSSEALFQVSRLGSLPQARRAVLCRLMYPHTGDTIDHGLVLWFPAPHSFTGEDCVEFHVHGGPSVVLALLSALAGLKGLRHAEPGDFTKQAFFNGKLDLTEVEGLADLIHAETEAQRRQALRQMEGDLSKLYEKWRKELLKCTAHVEAVIDFGEDESIEEGLLDLVREEVDGLQKEIGEHLDDGRRGERLRSGIHVAIVGAPNVGKSSLLNILCQRPAAIVSPYAGTTRDVLESALDIFGYPVILSDTAGLREAHDPVEQEGVRRALKRAETADLKILILDVSQLQSEQLLNPVLPEVAGELMASVMSVEGSSNEGQMHEAMENVLRTEETIVVLNKIDLLSQPLINKKNVEGTAVCWVSCKTGEGIKTFLDVMRGQLEHLCGNPTAGNPSITQARHRQHLSNCAKSLQSFQAHAKNEWSIELAAEELRGAIRELGRITGRVGVEDILDVIFKDFCIGK